MKIIRILLESFGSVVLLLMVIGSAVAGALLRPSELLAITAVVGVSSAVVYRSEDGGRANTLAGDPALSLGIFEIVTMWSVYGVAYLLNHLGLLSPLGSFFSNIFAH